MGDPNPSTNSSNISTNSSQISANSSQISANSSQISANSSQISANSSQISANSSQTSTNTGNIQRNRGDIDDLDAFVITPSEAANNPAAQGASRAQRLRIFVPNVKTVLAMGEPSNSGSPGGTRQEDTGEPTYSGFGVGTDGNIFMTAKGSATLQSTGHVGIHSFGTDKDNKNGSVYVGGNNQIALAAKTGNIVMNGGGGLLLCGGVAWPSAPATEDLPNYSVEVPSWVHSAVTTSSAIGNAWTVIDGAMAVLGLAMLAFEDKIQAESSKATKGWGYAGIASNIINIAGNVAGLAGREPLGGTTIHGHSGLIMGTGGTMGIYSLLGTGIASAIGVQMIAPTVAVTGAADATLESKGGTGVYGKNVQLISESSTLLTSRTGHTAVGGESITIGHNEAVGIQAATNGVTIQGKNSVALSAEDGGLDLTAGDGIRLTGTNSASVTTKSLVLAGSTEASIFSNKIHLGANDEATLSGGKGVIKLDGSEASIGFGVDSEISGAVSEIESQIAKNKDKIKGYHKTFMSAYKQPRDQRKIRMDCAKMKAQIAKENKALQGKINKLKQGKNAIVFKSGGIEIIFKGNKMKLDGSKVESGPIKWMK